MRITYPILKKMLERKSGIFVSNLYPFFTDTPILQSEQFGFKDKKVIPEFLISTPKDVVKDLIKGLKNKELHIYPGIVSQSIDLITRFFPGMVETLS